MSFGISATAISTISAVAGAVGAGVGIYGAVEGKKTADKQYEAQQAAFSDDIQAAIKNAEWSLDDNNLQFIIDNEKSTALTQAYVDATWDSFLAQEEYLNASSNLEALLSNQLTALDMTKAGETTQRDLQTIADFAELDAEYKVAVASIANTEALTRAAIDAKEYANTANLAVRALDGGIDVARQKINQIAEISDIETKEAIGKIVLKTADTVTAGGSSARKVQNSFIKADIMKNVKVQEQQNVIDKLTIQQDQTLKETQNKVTTILDRVHNAVSANNQRTIKDVGLAIANANVSMEDKISKLNSSLTQMSSASDLQTTAIFDRAGIQIDQARTGAGINITKILADHTANTTARTQQYDLTQYQTTRGLEQSIITQQSHSDPYEAEQNLLELYNKNPEYVKYAEQFGHLQIKADNYNHAYNASLLGYTSMAEYKAAYATGKDSNNYDVYNTDAIRAQLDLLKGGMNGISWN